MVAFNYLQRYSSQLYTFLEKYAFLVLILFMQATTSLSLHNSAFQDEAMYLDAGRRILTDLGGGEHIGDPFISYFSGLPYCYPVIAGALDSIGGLEAARLFSLACMLATTVVVYYIGQILFTRPSAVLGAAVFATQGSVLFLSHFATYDALCLVLIAVSTLLALRLGASPSYRGAVVIGCVLLLACIAKYAALLFLPSVLFTFGWTVWAAYGWKQACLRVGMALLPPILGFLLLLHSVPGLAQGMGFTTLHRQAMYPASSDYLVRQAVSLDGVLFLLAVVGFIRDVHPRRRFLLLVLLLTPLLAPVYHIDKLEETSFQKHIAYGEFFIAPLAGYALARFCGYGCLHSATGFFHRSGRIIFRSPFFALMACAALFYIGFGQARDLFGSWLDCGPLAQEARVVIRPKDNILAQNADVMRYYLRDDVGAYQWTFLTWFEYINHQREPLSGQTAYQAAIDEGYFDVIIFTKEAEAPNKQELITTLESQVRGSSRYRLEAQVPCSSGFGTNIVSIWHKVNSANLVSGSGNAPCVKEDTAGKLLARKEGPNDQRM